MSSKKPDTKIRTRIAPSPTGHLHLGTARTALYNYLFARKNNGTFVMRLEDTDEVRSKDEHTQDIFDGLRWLNINWDEGPDIGGPFKPYKQTEKASHYRNIADKLIASGHAYLCFATSEELDELREQQKSQNVAARYDNRHRHLTQEQIDAYIAEGRRPTIRFKIDEPRVVSWNDGIKGEISIDTSDLGGDMVIVKSSGIATYNFAVVVDDVDMEISHVIRGEDHIHNTAKQILMYEALGAQVPHFAHPALIFDIERRKLSKRFHGEAVHIERYRQLGYLPEAMVNYLAQMSWTHPENKEIFTLEEASRLFDLSKVSKSPAVFDEQRLNWFNSQYIRELSIDEVIRLGKPFLADYDLSKYSDEELKQMVVSVRDGLTCLAELKVALKFFFVDDIEISSEQKENVLAKESAAKVLAAFSKLAPTLPYGIPSECKAKLDALGKELGYKGKDLYWPVRLALSGSVQGPDLGTVLSALKSERIARRLGTALSLCNNLESTTGVK